MDLVSAFFPATQDTRWSPPHCYLLSVAFNLKGLIGNECLLLFLCQFCVHPSFNLARAALLWTLTQIHPQSDGLLYGKLSVTWLYARFSVECQAPT